MKQRIISGVVAALLLIAVISAGKAFTFIAIAVLAFVALCEYERAVGIRINVNVLIHNLLCSTTVMFVSLLKAELMIPLLCAYVSVLFVVMMVSKPKIVFEKIAKLLFGTMYICVFFAHIILVRNMDYGEYLVWIIFVCAFFTDSFAMLGGRYFGKRKIFPVLSPKKTLEGCIGGLIGSIVGMILFGVVVSVCGNTFNFFAAIILAITASVVSMLGDLSASSIKRQFGIKDYGKIMPGHGGVIDRLDSVLFVAPFVYYFMLVFPII